jgi:hypothetical protein
LAVICRSMNPLSYLHCSFVYYRINRKSSEALNPIILLGNSKNIPDKSSVNYLYYRSLSASKIKIFLWVESWIVLRIHLWNFVIPEVNSQSKPIYAELINVCFAHSNRPSIQSTNTTSYSLTFKCLNSKYSSALPNTTCSVAPKLSFSIKILG